MEQRHRAAGALSAPAGRRNAVEETVTHTQASSSHLRGFTCAFTRRNCTHEALFNPQYMRCFPHCCPQHVSRSYCGASVYLQVDLDEFATAVTRDNEIDDENMQVFGRFRLQEAHGLAVGEQVSLGIITSSLNSESNPTGEWVASRMIASAGHNAWLFEINPSAKWFYDWEVGAVRDRRFMPHVFEAYVLILCEERQANRARVQMTSAVVPLLSASTAPSLAHRSHLSESTETLEVVTLVVSSPFTLSSFRRAPSSRVRSHHAITELSSGEERAVEANELAQQDRSAPEGGTKAFGGSERSLDVDDDSDRIEDTQEEEEETSNPNLSKLVGDTDFDFDPKTICFRKEHDFDMEAKERASNAITPQPHVASAAKNTMLVNWFLHQIPLRAAQPFMELIEQYLSVTLWEQLQSSFVSGTSQPSARPVLPPNNLKMSAFVLYQLDASRSLPVAPDSTGNNNAASDNDHSDEQVPDVNELLIETLNIDLMLWMLFNKDNNAQMETFLQRSAKVLLDRVALYKSYEAWVEWLQERVGEYLFTQGWSQAGLVADIEDILKTGKASASSSGSAAFPAMIKERLVDESFFAADAHVAAGYEMFVAQARELYIAAGSLSSVAQSTQTRIHSRQSGADQTASGVCTANFTPVNPFEQLTGLWLSDWNAASCRDIASESAQTARQAPTDIMSLLWMWKQLGCIRMAFSAENGVPALLIGSVFNVSLSSSTIATENRVTRIVLDQQHHWFRCFPGGESSIGTRVGGQSFGDYVASGSGGADNFSVEIKCYSWPSNQVSSLWPWLSPQPASFATTPTALCWHWQLSPRTDHQGPRISVNITISSSQFDERKAEQGKSDPFHSSTSSIETLETESLGAKLALVRHWTPIYELEVPYCRLAESYCNM